MKKILPFIIAFSAFSIAGSAAYYSISGLSQLFAGATVAIMVMAAALELSKIVTASLLYQYRKVLPKLLKAYLVIAVIILVFITSMGIYGFLSSAYEEVSGQFEVVENQISLLESQKDNLNNQLSLYTGERSSMTEEMNVLRTGLATNVIQYTDTSGQIITTTSSATRRSLENQLNHLMNRSTEINTKIDDLNGEILDLEQQIYKTRYESGLSSELGPLKYLSDLTGYSMDQVVNILILIIIFVFDPLAITLVIASNFAFSQNTKEKNYKIYNEPKPIQPHIKEQLKMTPNQDEPPLTKEEPIPPPVTEEKPPPKDKNDNKSFLNWLKKQNYSAWRQNKLMREHKDDELTKTY